jgi:hypothetical protein
MEQPTVQLTGPTAETLADLLSCQADLAHCVELLDAQLDRPEAQQNDTVGRGLWEAAVLAYARVFASGVRHRARIPNHAVSAIDPLAMTLHEWLLGLRDKHLAHSVNAFDEVVVGCILASRADPPPRVIGVAHLSARRIGEQREVVESVRLLAHELGHYLDARIHDARELLLTEALALDVGELYGRPPMRATAPPDDALRKARRRGKPA